MQPVTVSKYESIKSKIYIASLTSTDLYWNNNYSSEISGADGVMLIGTDVPKCALISIILRLVRRFS